MQIAVFTAMLPDMTPEVAAPALKAAGYDGVEWRVTETPDEVKGEAPSFWRHNLCTFSPTQKDAQRACALSQHFDLATPNIGTYIGMHDMPGVEAAVEFAKTLGSPYFRMGFGDFTGNYAEQFSAARAFLADATNLAQKSGVKPLVEIHHRTIIPSAALAYRLVSHFSPQEVGVIYDAGNMVHEGFEDYRLGLELLGDYLGEVHLKNAAFRPRTRGVWQGAWAPLGSGMVDFHALFRALKGVGYDGWLVLEDFSETLPSNEALTSNLAFVRDTWDAA